MRPCGIHMGTLRDETAQIAVHETYFTEGYELEMDER